MSTVRTVAEQRVGDGASADIAGRSSFMGEAVGSSIHGFHYENTVRGRMFAYGISSQALLLSAATATNCPMAIWNPAGSNMVFIPTKVCLSFISGTTVIGAVNWHVTTNAGDGTIGTGRPILTFTHVAPVNMSVGGTANKSSAMRFAPTTATFTTAPAFLAATGLNLGAAAPSGSGTYEAKQDGSIVVYPNTCLSLCYTVTTSTALFAITIFGIELPIPAAN